MIDIQKTEHMYQIKIIRYQVLLVILNFSEKDGSNMEYI
jgi:hypothetical protein